jgi:hypothetical protein
MPRFQPIAAALAMVVCTGLVHGWWTQRWAVSSELTTAAGRLEAVPLIMGEWTGEPVALDPDDIHLAGLTRCWMRRYTQPADGDAFVVILMCGSPGPVAVHTPDWCYGAAGYTMATPAGRYRLEASDGAQPAEFWTAQFAKPDKPVPARLQIFWAWNATGSWQAPDYPRLIFGSQQALYKLYVIRTINEPERGSCAERDAIFLDQLLPELDRALFAWRLP